MITIFKKIIMMMIAKASGSGDVPPPLIQVDEIRFTADGGEKTFEINGNNWTIT